MLCPPHPIPIPAIKMICYRARRFNALPLTGPDMQLHLTCASLPPPALPCVNHTINSALQPICFFHTTDSECLAGPFPSLYPLGSSSSMLDPSNCCSLPSGMSPCYCVCSHLNQACSYALTHQTNFQDACSSCTVVHCSWPDILSPQMSCPPPAVVGSFYNHDKYMLDRLSCADPWHIYTHMRGRNVSPVSVPKA